MYAILKESNNLSNKEYEEKDTKEVDQHLANNMQ